MKRDYNTGVLGIRLSKVSLCYLTNRDIFTGNHNNKNEIYSYINSPKLSILFTYLELSCAQQQEATMPAL